MNSLVELDHVTCTYGAEPALVKVSLAIGPGDFVGIVGPSGSGKTTLLKTIAGAVKPVAGHARRSEDLRIGYVPQVDSVNWYFPVTVREAILMARTGERRAPWPSRTEIDEAETILQQLGLGGLSARHIRELSGGQQQRVFIARALLRGANLLLLDEPTSGIDVRTRHEIMHVLHDLHHENVAIALSTHDLNGIAAHLPHLICLNREVVAAGPPGDVVTPRVLERLYGTSMEILSHAGMPFVIESYPEIADVTPAEIVPIGEGHHEHPA